MTGADIKFVINEAMVKDNTSRTGTANAILSQEFCKKLDASINLQELRESNSNQVFNRATEYCWGNIQYL